MILPILAVVAATAQPYGHSNPNELAQAFAELCLSENASLETLPPRAAAAGFLSVAVIPSQLENREISAWRRGDLRLSATAGSQNPKWKLYPMCTVTADVGTVSSDKKILNAVGVPLQVAVINGQPGPKASMYHLISEKGIIDLSLNKQNSSHVIMSLLWQVGQPSPTVTH